jgi:hypothetical protein
MQKAQKASYQSNPQLCYHLNKFQWQPTASLELVHHLAGNGSLLTNHAFHIGIINTITTHHLPLKLSGQ